VLHDGMLYDPNQGRVQGHRVPKVAKVADLKLKVYLLRYYACNQKSNGEL